MSADLQRLARDGWLRRADAALGELVLRLFPDSAPAVGLAAALTARAIGEGHSALQLDAAQIWLSGFDGRGEPPRLPDPVSWQTILRGSDAVTSGASLGDDNAHAGKPLVLDARGRVYLRRYFDYECRLAARIIARATADSTISDEMNGPSRELITNTDSEQSRAAHTALRHRIALITGGPGTGKTHSVVRILALLAQRVQSPSRVLRIALTAPTGKAAARLAEAVRAQLAEQVLPAEITTMIPREAGTLHRLLGISPLRAQPKFHRHSRLPYDVVVVDEVSMVDLPLMTKLIDAIADDAHLVLLGDPDQLNAVEAGDVLGALVEAAREPPLADCHVRLTRSHRFAEHGELARLAAAIAAGDADSALAAFSANSAASLCEQKPRLALAHLLDEAVAAYRHVLDAADAASALRAANEFRVLTALRHGPSGCLALDRAIEQRLKRNLDVRAGAKWWHGRLLMVTANRAELDLFNGDVGVVWVDANDDMKVWFASAGGALRAVAPAALPPHEGAFALTVHKAQGSEFDRIALVLGADTKALTRELLYTGITRAREGIHIYGDATLLRASIARRGERWNGLADRLREAAAAAAPAPVSIAESLPRTF